MERPEWKDITIARDLSISFRKVGESILVITPKGDLSKIDSDVVQEIHDKIYKQAFTHAQQVVEIEDMQFVHGRPPKIERKKYYLWRNKAPEGYRGLIISGASFAVRTFVNSMYLFTKRPAFKIEFHNNYEHSIKRAVDILNVDPLELFNTIKSSDFITHHGWNYHSILRKYTGEFSVAKGFALYIKHHGTSILADDVRNLVVFEEKLFQELAVEHKHYIRIVDYTHLDQIPAALRNLYDKKLTRMHRRLGLTAVKTFVINPSKMIKTTLGLVQKIVNMKFVFVKDLDEAVLQINRYIDLSMMKDMDPEVKYTVSSKDIDALTEIIGSLVWDETGSLDQVFSKNHPLYQVSEAFELVKQEYQSLQSEVRLKNEELEMHTNKLKDTLDRVNEMAMKAEHANIAKSQFLVNISHDIRTPLNGIIGMTDLLESVESIKEQKEYLDIIRVSGDSLFDLVNAILDFSKLEAGNLSIEHISFDLHSALDVVSDILYFKAEEKDLEFGCIVAQDVPKKLVGDPGRFRQCLLNLVHNAIQYTEKGQVLVQISCNRLEGKKVELNCTITDTGVGIPEELQDEFLGVAEESAIDELKKYGGTGLGVTITRQLVELMHGEMGFNSTVGKGSEFWFTVLFEVDMSESEVIDKTMADISNSSILIVDDSQVHRMMYKNYLEPFGCKDLQVKSCQEGDELLSKDTQELKRFDIIVLDHCFVEKRGLQYFSTLKKKPVYDGKTKWIYITGKSKKGDAKEMKKAGFDGYLSKPVKREDLIKVFHGVLSGEEPDGRIVTRYSSPQRQLLHPAKILIVEDDVTSQKITVAMLNKLGFKNHDIAMNGHEAIELFRNNDYDLVIIDCQMPVMDGYQTTKIIRSELKGGDTTSIVALTANALSGDDERCFRAGMDDYIPKPIKLKVMNEKIHQWIKGRNQNQG